MQFVLDQMNVAIAEEKNRFSLSNTEQMFLSAPARLKEVATTKLRLIPVNAKQLKEYNVASYSDESRLNKINVPKKRKRYKNLLASLNTTTNKPETKTKNTKKSKKKTRL